MWSHIDHPLQDFELAIPIIYPQTTTLYQTDDLYYAEGGNGTTGGIFNTFLDAVSSSIHLVIGKNMLRLSFRLMAVTAPTRLMARQAMTQSSIPHILIQMDIKVS
jgi:hypothetical protein